MNFKEIIELIDKLESSGVSEFKYEKDKLKLNIKSKAYTEAMIAGKVVTNVTAAPIAMQAPSLQTAVNQPVVNNVANTNNAANVEPEVEETNTIVIKAPMVGTFYRSSSPDNPPFVKVGDIIEKGQTICMIEAMKLFNEIESEVSGKVIKVLIDDASPVEYDQSILIVEPS